jgi:hypothetical protein
VKTLAISRKERIGKAVLDSDDDVLLIEGGHAVALVQPFDDDDLEWYSRERDPAFIESIQRAREQVAAGQTVSHDDLMSKLSARDEAEMLGDLVVQSGAVCAGDAIDLVPDRSGLYAIFVARGATLPRTLGPRLRGQMRGLVYIGIASKSLRDRLIEQDLRHKRPSTFFRSLSAVLDFKPSTGSLRGKKNRSNFTFSPADTKSVMNWIAEHVRVKWMILDRPKRDLEGIERRLITQNCPVLNLAHNKQALSELAARRRDCRRAANS